MKYFEVDWLVGALEAGFVESWVLTTDWMNGVKTSDEERLLEFVWEIEDALGESRIELMLEAC